MAWSLCVACAFTSLHPPALPGRICSSVSMLSFSKRLHELEVVNAVVLQNIPDSAGGYK